jgi:hypothetical protein
MHHVTAHYFPAMSTGATNRMDRFRSLWPRVFAPGSRVETAVRAKCRSDPDWCEAFTACVHCRHLARSRFALTRVAWTWWLQSSQRKNFSLCSAASAFARSSGDQSEAFTVYVHCRHLARSRFALTGVAWTWWLQSPPRKNFSLCSAASLCSLDPVVIRVKRSLRMFTMDSAIVRARRSAREKHEPIVVASPQGS